MEYLFSMSLANVNRTSIPQCHFCTFNRKKRAPVYLQCQKGKSEKGRGRREGEGGESVRRRRGNIKIRLINFHSTTQV